MPLSPSCSHPQSQLAYPPTFGLKGKEEHHRGQKGVTLTLTSLGEACIVVLQTQRQKVTTQDGLVTEPQPMLFRMEQLWGLIACCQEA